MLDFIAERRIAEAIARGELSNLPGEDAAARAKAVRKLSLLRTRIDRAYFEQAVARLAR